MTYGQAPATAVAGIGAGFALLYGAAGYWFYTRTRDKHVKPPWLGWWLTAIMGIRAAHAMGWTAVRLQQYHPTTTPV
jgi:hypothetical protein